MIRQSLALAATAVALSLAAHFVGVGLTFRTQAPTPENPPQTDVVALGNSFEELVEAPITPVFPDTAPSPEPAPEPDSTPEPETAEAPTSDVKVASATPKQTFAPDASVAPEVRPNLTEPVVPETLEAQETSDTDADEAAPVQNPGTIDPQQGAPDGGAEPVQAVPAAPSVSPAPEQLAALPTPSPAPPVLPVAPSDTDEPDPAPQRDAEAPATSDADGQVTTSLRPRLRVEGPSPLPQGTNDGTGVAPQRPQLIESPLTAYQRSGVNVFGGQSSRSSSGRAGFAGSGGVGNSDTTNYAGQVLVHLNRTPPVAVSGRGWARVFFEINPNGSLATVDVIDGSGSAEIDRAAKAQVRRGEPFPLPPNGQRRKLNFVYRIQ